MKIRYYQRIDGWRWVGFLLAIIGAFILSNADIDTQYYTMDYSRLTPFFIEAIKELKTKLEAAEARLAVLEG